MHTRNKSAYVWKEGRFEGDIEFWKHAGRCEAVKRGECLRLFLNIADDFQCFHDATSVKLQSTEWLDAIQDDEIEENEI